MAHDYVSQPAAKAITITIMILTVVVGVVRLLLPFIRQRRSVSVKDVWLLVALALFTSQCILFFVMSPALFRLSAVAENRIAFYPEILDDIHFIMRAVFACSIVYWSALWAVKFSLLAFYKQLMVKLAVYKRLWWTVAFLCCLSYMGLIITLMFVCGSDVRNIFRLDRCSARTGTLVGIWMSYAWDVVTDLMIMLLPLGMIRQARLPFKQKIGISSIFCLALFCIGAATVRIFEVASSIISHTPRSVIWLLLWSVIETSVAVAIGSAPGIYEAVRATARSGSRSPTLPSNQYDNNKRLRLVGNDSIDQLTPTVYRSQASAQGMKSRFDDACDSQEALTDPKIVKDGICVTRSTTVESGDNINLGPLKEHGSSNGQKV